MKAITEARALCESGRVVSAIKLLRDKNPKLGLSGAKAWVDKEYPPAKPKPTHPDADIEVLVRTDNAECPLVVAYWDGAGWYVAHDGFPVEPAIGRVLGWADTDEAIKQVKWNV